MVKRKLLLTANICRTSFEHINRSVLAWDVLQFYENFDELSSEVYPNLYQFNF